MLTDSRVLEIYDAADGPIAGRLLRFARAIEAEVLQDCGAQNAIHAPQDALSRADATQAQEPVAWALFSDNGNIRIWTSASLDVKKLAEEQGLSLSPLYAAPQPPAPCQCPDPEQIIALQHAAAAEAQALENVALRAEIERLTQKNAELREKLHDESAQHVQFMLHDHPKALAARDATIAQQVSEIETWRMRFYEADNHRITAASKVADQEQLKRTIELQAERIAELEAQNEELCRKYQEHAGAKYALQDKLKEQAALIEKCEKFAADIPGNGSMLGFVSESARLDVLAAIAAQKGGA